MLQPIGTRAQAVMDKLIEGISQGGSKKIDNTGGSFMPVSVERVGEISLGPLFSVTHYYEQNGDLMSDPDMVFVQGASGRYYPISYRQDGLGINQEVLRETEKPGSFQYNKRLSASLATFANRWMKNIKDQQRL